MGRKSRWFIVIGLVSLLLVAFTGTALAADPPANNAGQVGWCGAGGQGGGCDEDIAALLGLTSDQIREQRADGKSLVQIAAAQGVSEETLINAIITDKKAALQQLVTAGTITQAQADERLVFMTERVKEAVNRTTVGAPAWSGANGNRQNGAGNCGGIMARGGQRGNQANGTGTCNGAGGMRSGRAAK
ncbi:MAG: hypothetical protein PHR56_03790 [Dehalococcoidales bacterium]|nr:hypothetical protein [Dehalococcoidales bacterium]